VPYKAGGGWGLEPAGRWAIVVVVRKQLLITLGGCITGRLIHVFEM